jgi:hypothetical protein
VLQCISYFLSFELLRLFDVVRKNISLLFSFILIILDG